MLRTELIAPVPELLRRHAGARPEKIAFRDARGSITYGGLEAGTGNLAGHLAGLGIAPGDRVAVLLPNSVEWVVAMLAATRAGAVGVPVSYDSSRDEIAYRLDDANCKAVFTTDERAGVIGGIAAEASAPITTILVDRGENRAEGARFSDLVSQAPPAPPPDPPSIDAPAFVLYTSGTTGRAKGVLLSVRGMLWVAASCWAPIVGLSERDHVLSPLPLFHSYALNLSVLTIVALGASERILERYSTGEVLALLGSGEYTFFPGVPTMFHYLLEAGREAGVRELPGLERCVSAGAIMPATLNREFEAHFATPLLDGYGITETSTMVTMNWPDGVRVPGSCGLPVPGLATRIVDSTSGIDVPFGDEGELIVRGPNLMHGYLNKPEQTAEALRGGWYHTGDLARSDPNGYLTITGRLKELIIRGGQNIAPTEIEEIANGCEGVLDCAVVGIEHEHLGEVPVIFVVERARGAVDAPALLDHCAERLSSYKVPHSVQIVGEIPRTGSGKIIRFKLREGLAAG